MEAVPTKVPVEVTRKERKGRLRALKAGNLLLAATAPAAPITVPITPPTVPPLTVALGILVSKRPVSPCQLVVTVQDSLVMCLLFFFGKDLHDVRVFADLCV